MTHIICTVCMCVIYLFIYSHIYLSFKIKKCMGLIVLLYLSIFYMYFCFALFYFIYCKISHLYYILFYFYFCFIIFSRKSQLSIDLLQRHVQLKKASKNIFGGKKSSWLHTYGRKGFSKEKRKVL